MNDVAFGDLKRLFLTTLDDFELDAHVILNSPANGRRYRR